jgi:hypothetical protein
MPLTSRRSPIAKLQAPATVRMLIEAFGDDAFNQPKNAKK